MEVQPLKNQKFCRTCALKMERVILLALLLSATTIHAMDVPHDDMLALIQSLREEKDSLNAQNKDLGDDIESLKEEEEGLIENTIIMDKRLKIQGQELTETKEAVVKMLRRNVGTNHVHLIYVGSLHPQHFPDAYLHIRRLDPKCPEHEYNQQLTLLNNAEIAYKKIGDAIKDPEWNPFLLKMIDGRLLTQLNQEDPKLVELCVIWGQRICALIKAATLDLAEYNQDGRDGVRVPWNYIDPEHQGRYGIPVPYARNSDEPMGYATVVSRIGKDMMQADRELRECRCHGPSHPHAREGLDVDINIVEDDL